MLPNKDDKKKVIEKKVARNKKYLQTVKDNARSQTQINKIMKENIELI